QRTLPQCQSAEDQAVWQIQAPGRCDGRKKLLPRIRTSDRPAFWRCRRCRSDRNRFPVRFRKIQTWPSDSLKQITPGCEAPSRLREGSPPSSPATSQVRSNAVGEVSLERTRGRQNFDSAPLNEHVQDLCLFRPRALTQ